MRGDGTVVAAPLSSVGAGTETTALQRAWRRAARRPPALAGATVVLLYVLLALGAPWIAPADPLRTDWSQVRKAPSAAHPLGTDDLGRDVLSRVIWGTRISMQAGVFSILLALVVGGPAGLLAGFYPGGFHPPHLRPPHGRLAF